MKLMKKHWIGIGFGLAMIVGGLIFFLGDKIFYLLLSFGCLTIVLPFIVDVVISGGRQRKKEERFLEFIRDLVENVKSGTPISKGVVNLKNRDYGVLSPGVKKLANQVSVGIPLVRAFSIFAKDTKNKVIARAVSLISEAERSGGEIDVVLESVSSSVNQIQELKKERKAAVSNLVVQGYLIFLVFIVIMLVLQYSILPMTADFADVGALSLSSSSSSAESVELGIPLFAMLLVQSLFAGFVIGKISEGSLKLGLKHSFILFFLTLIITTGANVFFS